MKAPENNETDDPDISDEEVDGSGTCQNSQHEITPEITAPAHRRYDSQHEITPEMTAPAHRRYPVRQKKTFCRYGQNIYEQ